MSRKHEVGFANQKFYFLKKLKNGYKIKCLLLKKLNHHTLHSHE